MSESEFMDRMIKAFDYFDVIKKIDECDDEVILKILKKLIDKRISKLGSKSNETK